MKLLRPIRTVRTVPARRCHKLDLVLTGCRQVSRNQSWDAPKSGDISESGAGGTTDEDDQNEQAEHAAVQQTISGLLLTGFTKAARWRRQVERRPPEVRRTARVVRKMEERRDTKLNSESEASSPMALLHSTSDGE